MRLSIIAALLLCVAGRAKAQITETPVPFDSAQRVTAVTPSLAERLRLSPPVWPVQGEFRDARLFAVQPGGGFVLVVQRPAGAVDRYPLTAADRAALRAAIDAAMAASGRPSAESGSDVLSEPAGNAFARRQTLLAAVLYGPLAASLTDDASAAGALYLIVTGGTFFTTYGMAQSQNISRAQNHLAGHLGIATGAAGWLLGYAGTGNSDKGVRALALGSAVVGTVAGVSLGRTLSDAEAHSATAGVEAGALLSLAGGVLAGASDRGAAAAAAAGIVAGYPIGLAYPRRVSYTVTAGDVDAVGTTGLIGTLFGGALLGKDPKKRPTAVVLGATYLGGLWVGDRAIARQYDLTQSESNIAGVGAVAGGLVGLALPTLAGSNEPALTFGAAAVGAAVGMAAIVSMSPHRVNGAPASRRSFESGARESGNRFRVDFGPSALLGVVSKVPGRYPLVHVGF